MGKSTMGTLSIRVTNKYVGRYRHLDQWQEIGTYEILKSHTVCTDEEDICEPQLTTHEVLVTSSSPEADVRKALDSEFTLAGCAHDWDCCGCRSFHTRKTERVTGDLWCVEVSSSRNY